MQAFSRLSICTVLTPKAIEDVRVRQARVINM